MRRLSIFLFFVLAILGLIFFKSYVLAITFPTPPKAPERIIIKFRESASSFSRESLLKTHKISIKEKIKLPNTFVFSVPAEKKDKLIKIFSQSKLIDYIEPDFKVQKVEIPNDPYYSNQWGLAKIQASLAFDVTHGSSTTKIAIVDTGIDDTHPDLSGRIVGRANFTTDADFDGDGHGTHVAGIASSITNNGIGVAGTGYDSRLLSVKVLDNNGSGYYSWVANGIIWASDNGAKVINLSLGGTSSSFTLQNAVNYAWDKGTVVVAAAGNRNSTSRFYPAYYSNSIATAATDQNDKKASFSTYGSWVDVAAPGVSIISTYKGDYTYFSGTSMAAPYVSGLAGLIFGFHPDWNNFQVRDKLQSSSDQIPGTGFYWTYGRINACKALDGCTQITLTPTPTLTPSPTPTLTPTPTPSITPSPTPIPTPSSRPWWCKYIPSHSLCQ